jgi:hypothetical protein
MKDLIENQDWDDIIKRLTSYANHLVAGNSWLQSRAGLPPGGKGGEDYAMNAIRKLFESEKTGKRKWDPERVNLFVFLKGVVRSDISTDVESVENVLTQRPSKYFDAESSSDTTLLEVIESFGDDENVVKAIELYMDGATDEQVKAALGVKRAELVRIKSCLRAYFELKTPDKQQRKSNI